MKRLLSSVLIIAFLLCSVPLLSSCETSVLASTLFGASAPSAYLENDWYILWNELLYDKQTGELFVLEYEKNGSAASNSGVRYSYISQYEFIENGIEKHTFAGVPKYDVNTGDVAYYEYYEMVIHFGFDGCETGRTVSDTALIEAEMFMLAKNMQKEGSRFYFDSEQGSGRERYEPEDTAPEYTELEQRAVDYALSLEKKLKGEYHYTVGKGEIIGGRLWFSVTRSNQKDWGSQSATFNGIYSSMVVCYSPETDSFEHIIELKNDEYIIAFDEKNAMTYDGSRLRSYSYETGRGKTVHKFTEDAPCYGLQEIGGYVYFYDYVTLKGETEDFSWSYPTEHHTLLKLNGEKVFDADGLTLYQKTVIEKSK